MAHGTVRRLHPAGEGKRPANGGAPRAPAAGPGYTYGTAAVAKSPITLAEWEELKKSALFSEEDIVYLRLSHDVLADQVDTLLKTWRGVILDHAHLRAYNEDRKTGDVDTDYTGAVAKRFGQWVLDTTSGQFDQAWLDYQYEIGLRHQEESDRPRSNRRTHPCARRARLQCRDRRADEGIPCQQRPSTRDRRPYVRRVVEDHDPVHDAVDSALLPSRRFLR